MQTTNQYIVGREVEVRLLDNILRGILPYSKINIYGPGGIGKTVVCQKLAEHCIKERTPYAVVRGDDSTVSTIDQLLYRFRQGLQENVTNLIPNTTFGSFDSKFNDYLIVKDVIERGGGITKMFDLAGIYWIRLF